MGLKNISKEHWRESKVVRRDEEEVHEPSHHFVTPLIW